MERKVGFEHTLTKKMSITKYLAMECPKEYTIVSRNFISLNQVEVTYSNIVPVIVGINLNNFGLPETRETVKKVGTYFDMVYAPKDTKHKPIIPSWAEFTGNVIPLNEWSEGYEYVNKEEIILKEIFSFEKEEYKVQDIKPKSLQRKRIK